MSPSNSRTFFVMVAMWRFPAEVQRKKMLKWKIWDFISWFIRNTTMAEKKYTGAPFGTQTARYTIRLILFLGQLGGVFMTPINRFRIINRTTLHALLYLSCQEICNVWITDCFCYCIIICIILDLTSLECTPKVNIPGPSQRSRMIKSPLMNW